MPADAGRPHRPHRARVLARERHVGRLLALPGDRPGLYGMQEVRGSNPLSSTRSEACWTPVKIIGEQYGEQDAS
jgi:hypothetical protein